MAEGTRNGLSLGTKILIGVLIGIAFGIFLGELSRPFGVAGRVYVGLLQMTVLPYVAVSLIAKVGKLSVGEAKPLAGRAGLVMLALWGIALATVLLMPLSLPEWKAGTFFSSSLVERPERLDFLALYIPTNPFHSLANNVVPASVLFSILVGVALIGVPNKQSVLRPLQVFSDALSRIAKFVVRLAPWGTFALAAGASGTLSPAELVRLAGYASTYTVAVLLLTFVVLPGFVAALTPFRFREVLSDLREAGLTAFATGKLFAVLPMVIDGTRQMLVRRGVDEEEAKATADLYVPLGYPLPNAGKILALLFIPFAAWFVGRPLEPSQYPLLLSIGLLSFFGSPVAAVPFLLDVFRLPADLFPLFLVAGIWCARLGDLAGVMHLSAFTVLSAAWREGWLRWRPARLGVWLAYSTGAGVLALAANHYLVKWAMARQEPSRSIVESLELVDELVAIEVEEEAGPNPAPLLAGEARLDRVRRTSELRIGYVPESPPFCYRNARGKLVGLDVDLAQRLASELGVALTLVPYARENLAAAFAADHFDVAVGGIASSLEHFDLFHESAFYLNLHVAIVTRDNRTAEFATVEVMRHAEDLRLGYVTTGHLARTRRHHLPAAELVQLSSAEDYLRAEEPEVDALITTAETGSVLTMLFPSHSVIVPEGAVARVPLVFAVQRENELDRLIDRWIRLKKEDGTVDELYSRWILGKQAAEKSRRWSILHDVLGW